jgi:hypothetical protein
MEMAKMLNMTETMPDTDFLARYLPRSLSIVKLLRQSADSYKVWDSRMFALDVDYYFGA